MKGDIARYIVPYRSITTDSKKRDIRQLGALWRDIYFVKKARSIAPYFDVKKTRFIALYRASSRFIST
jgi:hypothetical protein